MSSKCILMIFDKTCTLQVLFISGVTDLSMQTIPQSGWFTFGCADLLTSHLSLILCQPLKTTTNRVNLMRRIILHTIVNQIR